MIDVAVIGADDDVVAANFDDATNTWLLRTSSGGERRARVVIDERTLHLAAEWDPAFDPTGKRIAVIGDRAAHVLPKLAGAQATLFDCPAILMRTPDGFSVWVQSSYSAHFLATAEQFRAALEGAD